MMRKQRLEEILATRDTAVKRHRHLIPVMVDLYHAGCTIKQLMDMFQVSKKFVRSFPDRVDDFEFRPIGPRDPSAIPTADQVLAVLKKHGLGLADLPESKDEAPPKPKAKKRSK